MANKYRHCASLRADHTVVHDQPGTSRRTRCCARTGGWSRIDGSVDGREVAPTELSSATSMATSSRMRRLVVLSNSVFALAPRDGLAPSVADSRLRAGPAQGLPDLGHPVLVIVHETDTHDASDTGGTGRPTDQRLHCASSTAQHPGGPTAATARSCTPGGSAGTWSMRSRTLRPRRSRRQTATASPGSNTSLSRSSSGRRPARVDAFSMNNRSQPASLSASIWRSRFWSRVETRGVWARPGGRVPRLCPTRA